MSTTTEMTFADRAERLHAVLSTASDLVAGLGAEELSEFLGYVQSEQASPISYAFIREALAAVDPSGKDVTALGLCAAGLDGRAPASGSDPADPWAQVPNEEAPCCEVCGGELWAPHFYIWNGVTLASCNGCSGDRSALDAAAARLRSTRGQQRDQ